VQDGDEDASYVPWRDFFHAREFAIVHTGIGDQRLVEAAEVVRAELDMVLLLEPRQSR
jgi:hypothetical protein